MRLPVVTLAVWVGLLLVFGVSCHSRPYDQTPFGKALQDARAAHRARELERASGPTTAIGGGPAGTSAPVPLTAGYSATDTRVTITSVPETACAGVFEIARDVGESLRRIGVREVRLEMSDGSHIAFLWNGRWFYGCREGSR